MTGPREGYSSTAGLYPFSPVRLPPQDDDADADAPLGADPQLSGMRLRFSS